MSATVGRPSCCAIPETTSGAEAPDALPQVQEVLELLPALFLGLACARHLLCRGTALGLHGFRGSTLCERHHVVVLGRGRPRRRGVLHLAAELEHGDRARERPRLL